MRTERTLRATGLVLAGVAGSAGSAMAAGRGLAAAGDQAPPLTSVVAVGTGVGSVPAVQALSLVALAGWGVLLVLRGRARRAVAVLVALAASAAAVLLVVRGWSLPGDVAEAYARAGLEVRTGLTAWYAVCLAGSVLGAAAAVVAVWLVPRWPEMGRRFDAPGGVDRPSGRPPERPSSNADLWRALDEGRDPTDGAAP